MKNQLESDFKRYLFGDSKTAGIFEGWHSTLHPGLGSDVGIPDKLILSEEFGLIPVELKIGSIDEDGMLWCSAVRPAQIVWHFELSQAGGYSFFLIGVHEAGRWRIFAFDGAHARNWEQGFKIGTDDITELFPDHFDKVVDIYLDRYIIV